MKPKRHRWWVSLGLTRVYECTPAQFTTGRSEREFDCDGCGATLDCPAELPRLSSTLEELDILWANGIGPFAELVNEAKAT